MSTCSSTRKTISSFLSCESEGDCKGLSAPPSFQLTHVTEECHGSPSPGGKPGLGEWLPENWVPGA